MNRRTLLLVLILLITSAMYAQFLISETATIDAMTLHKIREACNPTTYPNSQYADDLVLSACNYATDGLDDYIDAGDDITDDCPVDFLSDAKTIFSGVFTVKTVIWQEMYLPPVNDYLQDEFYAEEFIEWCMDTNEHNDARGHHAHIQLNYLAFIADMLFYAPTSIVSADDHDNIVAKIDSIVVYCEDLFENLPYYESLNADGKWGLPGSSSPMLKNCIIQQRPCLLSAMGHFVLILMQDDDFMAIPGNSQRMNDDLDLINNDFCVNDYFGDDGILDFNTQESGSWGEGPGYQAVSYLGMTNFFTAYKRVSNGSVNYYNLSFVRKNIEHAINIVTNELKHLPYDDTWNFTISSRQLIHGIAEFFYNNTNDTELRNKCGWYIKNFINYSTSTPTWPHEISFDNPKCYIVFSYNPDTDIPISSTFDIPEEYTQGLYSNSEYSILREPVLSQQNLIENPAMYILHENSVGGYHDQGDQTSYLLYYKGKQLIMDPGYHPDAGSTGGACGLDWCQSSFAHNLVTVEPDSLAEYEELDLDFWNFSYQNSYSLSRGHPKGNTTYNANPACPDPAYRHYAISNNDIQSVKATLDYHLSSVTPSLERYYYKLGDEFFVFDKLQNNSANNLRYWNSIHFSIGLDSESVDNSLFSLSDDDAYLYGAFSSDISESRHFNEFAPNLLPNSARYLPTRITNSNYFHKRLHLSVNARNPQFMTCYLLKPSSGSPLNQNVVEGNGYYAVSYDMNTADSYTSYAGIKQDSVSSILYNYTHQVLVQTDAEFFVVETDNDFDSYRKIILNGGNDLTLQTNTVVFDSDTTIEELLVDYTDGLHVTFKTDTQVYPRYKILRCGVDPANIHSSTEWGSLTASNGTIENNINTLAYDADYFYVNYTLSEFQSEGLLDDVVIYSGDFTNALNGISTDVTFGTGSLTFSGGMGIPSGVTVTFLASAQPEFMANGYISVNGSLVAQGTVDHPVVFTAESTQWSGIAVNTGGALNFDYTEISKADNAILCYGAITLTNSTVHLCENGVTLQSTTSPIIQNNQLFDCNSYGLKMSSVASSFGTPVRDNEIYQNGIGVILYNSTYSLSENDIHNNTTHALHASSKSSATISNSFLGLTDGANPEIYLLDSYPVLHRQYNDIIFDFGTQNSYSIYNASLRLSSYSCGDNYWGTTNTSIIAESFYPSSWPVTYSPLSSSANTSYRESTVEDLLLLAITNENQGNYLEAESIFKSIVSTYPDSLESLQSLGHLLNCNTTGNQGFEDLQSYYRTIAQNTIHFDLARYAEDYVALCNRRMQVFDEALREYDNQLSNPLNYVDSLFTEIDIVQTIQEANASNVGRYMLSRSELQKAQKREQELFDLLTREFQPSNGVSSPGLPFELHSNYPNPFNPTTTISYSIPVDGEVELSIFNVKGQKVTTLVQQHQEAGEYATQWNGTDDDNNSVSSGVYFYRLSDDHGNNKVQKCLLLK